MAAGNVFRRALRVLRDEGWKSFAFKVAGELGYRRMVIVEHRLDNPIPPFTPRLAVRNGLLRLSDLDAYRAFRPDSDRAEIVRRLDTGELCFVAWHEGEIVSACWTALKPVHIDFIDCESGLLEGDAYIYDKFTSPAHRGRRLGNAVRAHQLGHLRAMGRIRAVGAIVPENRVSLHESLGHGFRPVGMIRTIRLGPWRRIFVRRWE